VSGRAAPHPEAGSDGAAAKERHFYARDSVAMARVLGVVGRSAIHPVRPVVEIRSGWRSSRRRRPPAFSNNHLGYALTWFGLALALVGFYVALLRRQAGAGA
jgi:surfeit locus 1 family protein